MNPERFFQALSDPENAVRTNNRFRVWWLKVFAGYRVKKSFRIPKAGLFGRIRYDVQWVLTPQSVKK